MRWAMRPAKSFWKKIQTLFEHVTVVLPANQAGHAGVQGLMHQQVMQANEYWAQNQCNHRHPGQFETVILEKKLTFGVPCARSMMRLR